MTTGRQARICAVCDADYIIDSLPVQPLEEFCSMCQVKTLIIEAHLRSWCGLPPMASASPEFNGMSGVIAGLGRR